jgi:hypothetical protein
VLDHIFEEEQKALTTARNLIMMAKLHKLRRMKRYLNKIKTRTRRPKEVKKWSRPEKRSREPEDIFRNFNVYKMTGLFPDVFNEVFQRISHKLSAPRQKSVVSLNCSDFK